MKSNIDYSTKVLTASQSSRILSTLKLNVEPTVPIHWNHIHHSIVYYATSHLVGRMTHVGGCWGGMVWGHTHILETDHQVVMMVHSGWVHLGTEVVGYGTKYGQVDCVWHWAWARMGGLWLVLGIDCSWGGMGETLGILKENKTLPIIIFYVFFVKRSFW